MPKLVQVIESHVCRGKGTETDRCRSVRQYHDTEGGFLAEDDPSPACELSRDEVKALLGCIFGEKLVEERQPPGAVRSPTEAVFLRHQYVQSGWLGTWFTLIAKIGEYRRNLRTLEGEKGPTDG